MTYDYLALLGAVDNHFAECDAIEAEMHRLYIEEREAEEAREEAREEQRAYMEWLLRIYRV